MKIFQYLQGHITYAQYLLYGKNISFLHILFQRSAMYIFHDDVTKVTPLCVINHLWQIGMFKKSEQSGLSSAAGRQLFYRTKNAKFQITCQIHGTFTAPANLFNDAVASFQYDSC